MLVVSVAPTHVRFERVPATSALRFVAVRCYHAPAPSSIEARVHLSSPGNEVAILSNLAIYALANSQLECFERIIYVGEPLLASRVAFNLRTVLHQRSTSLVAVNGRQTSHDQRVLGNCA